MGDIVKMNMWLMLSIVLALLFMSCKKSTTENETPGDSSIEVVTLSPEPESTISSQDTIKALLDYVIAEGIQSDYGFSVSIKFQSVIENQTLSVGTEASISIIKKKDQIQLVYPLSLIWRSSDLKHPVSCYFYLQNYTSETKSTVIAKTTVINFSE